MFQNMSTSLQRGVSVGFLSIETGGSKGSDWKEEGWGAGGEGGLYMYPS
jgi:hypothetical protein